MSWRANQVFEFYADRGRQRVQGDSWHSVLTVPAGDLKALHSYALVLTGLHGKYSAGTGIGVVNAGAIEIEYSGVGLAGTLHRFDLAFGEMQHPANPDFAQSFCIIGTVSCGVTPLDIIVRAQCQDAGAAPRSSFELEGLALQVYDLTDWPGAQYLATASTATLKPHSDPALAPLLELPTDLTHGSPAKRWLLWYSIVLEAQDQGGIPTSWLTSDASSAGSSDIFYRRPHPFVLGSWIGHTPRGRIGYWHRQHIGAGRVVEVGAAGFRPRLWAADLWKPSAPTKVHHLTLFAVNIDGIADEVHADYQPTGNWSPAEEPNWFSVGVDTSFFDDLRVLAITRGRFRTETAELASFKTALDVDSTRISPILHAPMRVMARHRQEVQSIVRGGRVRADAGKHCIRHTQVIDGDASRAATCEANDHQVLVLSTAPGYGLSQPPADLIGPEVVIVPGKEAVDVGSLPSLPIAPNAPVAWEELDPAFEMETGTGYTISWPLSLEPRRRTPLLWTGLTEDEKAQLTEWLRSRADSGSAFQWTPPDSDAALPFVLEPGFRWRHLSGTKYEVSASAIELRYTGV